VIGLQKKLCIMSMLLALCSVPAITWAHSEGNHPLINAAGRGDLPQVKALIATKIDVNDGAGITRSQGRCEYQDP
jgi:hypothetical protein